LDARITVQFAQHYVGEILSDYSSGAIPQDVELFAHTQAVRKENFALRQYADAMRIYRDLVVNGVIPNEEDWHKSRTAGGETVDWQLM